MTLDLDETFIYDSVVHAYNFRDDNMVNHQHAEIIRDMIFGSSAAAATTQERSFVTREAFERNWSVDDLANQLFYESQTDMATFQPLPLYAFEDGLCANENAKVATEKYPQRFDAFATIDPLDDDWEEDLRQQAEWFDLSGIKLYPSSWSENSHDYWHMNDDEVAYPVFEKAKEMDIDLISVHKAVPFGPVPREPYDPSDVDEPAENFPELEFSIIHGGFAFTEETAWQVARFPNVHVCMEALGILAAGNDEVFGDIMAELVKIIGPQAYDSIYWSSAAIAYHPLTQLKAFRDFEYTDDHRDQGYGVRVPQITDEDKRKMLGENYADLLGIDIEEARAGFADDKFSQEVQSDGIADPWSTVSVEADQVV